MLLFIRGLNPIRTPTLRDHNNGPAQLHSRFFTFLYDFLSYNIDENSRKEERLIGKTQIEKRKIDRFRNF